MHRTTLPCLLMLLTTGVCFAQDPFSSPPNPPAVQFGILLGPDLKPEDTPFLDPYELRQHFSRNFAETEFNDISVDVETALPTQPGPYLLVRLPESTRKTTTEADKAKLRTEALRFGINHVELEWDETAVDTQAIVRIGVLKNGLQVHDWQKYMTAARALSKSPRIEIYQRIASQYASDAGGFGGSSPAPSIWATPSGVMEEGDLLVSWSVKDKIVAAMATSGNTGWVRTSFTGDRITPPTTYNGIVVFISEDAAYGFSVQAGTWAKVDVKWNGEQPPNLSLSNVASIKTDDDVLIFTHAGRWFSRNSATVPELAMMHGIDDDMMQPSMGMGDMGGGMGMGGMGAGGLGGMGGGMPGMGMGGMGMGGTESPQDPATYRQLIATISQPLEELRRDATDLESRGRAVAEEIAQTKDEQQQAKLREELKQIAIQSVRTETLLRRVELLLINTKVQFLELQLQLRNAQNDKLVDDRLNEWIK